MRNVIYTDTDRDYPKGYVQGMISMTKVKNAARKRGWEVVNASNCRVNNVKTGSCGFIRDSAGRHVYWHDEDNVTLYRTASDDRDYTGGSNHFCRGLDGLMDGVESLFRLGPAFWEKPL